MSFIAGGYTLTYGGSTLGQIEDGISHQHSPHYEAIRGDNLGDVLQDGVYRGASVFVSFTLIEWNATAVQALMWPWSATHGTLGTIGRLMTGIKTIGTPGGAGGTGTLVATAVSGTPAAATPATRTYHLAMIPDGADVSYAFAPRLRRLPVRLIVLPTSGGVLWTDT